MRPNLASLIDNSIDPITPQVSVKGINDLEELKKEFRRVLAFWGGIETQYLMPMGNPEEIRDRVRRTVEILNRDGGYFLYSVYNTYKRALPQNIPTF